ncbi:MAG: hypothetical protein ACI4DV_02600 [Lachnospiraceae bacterium]
MRYVPEFCSMTVMFLWMSYEDLKTGYVYRFQSYLVIIFGMLIYAGAAKGSMHLQLILYMTEVGWLVKKEYLGRGDGYVYFAMALSLSAISDGNCYLLTLFVHQLLANLFFCLFAGKKIKLPVFRLGAHFAFIPSLFYSWLSVVVSSSVVSFSGR